MNRRTFISSAAIAATALATRSRLLASAEKPKLTVGVIGCGWFGGVNLGHLQAIAEVDVVALSDPNQKALETFRDTFAGRQTKTPRLFADYRKMLAAGPLDVVLVATPDHWHALPAIEAMRAGADVLLEKPIGVDVLEGEALVAAARKYHRVVQVNLQRRSNPLFAAAREKYIRSGRLGAIGRVEAYSYLAGRSADPIPTTEPPAHLDFDLWTGPAPKLPYRALLESRGWRSFMEYGNGQIGDLGVHKVDLARWMLGLGWPESIQSSGGIYVDRTSPATISDTQYAIFHYPGLDLTWEHRTWGRSPIPQRHWTDQWGVRFLGKNGTLNLTMLCYEFTPADGGPTEGVHLCSKTGNLENVDFSAFDGAYDETSRRHLSDFLHARETRGRPVSDIEEGHISSACCQLANLAQELGRTVRYDPRTRRVRDDDEATRRLARAYRGPWQHPDPATV